MSGNPEVDKAVNQLEAQRPPVENAADVVDNAVGKYEGEVDDWTNAPAEDHHIHDPAHPANPGDKDLSLDAQDPEPEKAPAKKAAKKTSSGNRAEKQNSKEE